MCVFVISNRVFTEGTCKLINLVISDLVDEDCVLHNRCQAVSALMFGTAAFLSKPGQTFAPLLGTWLLFVNTGMCIILFNYHKVELKIKVILKNMFGTVEFLKTVLQRNITRNIDPLKTESVEIPVNLRILFLLQWIIIGFKYCKYV